MNKKSLVVLCLIAAFGGSAVAALPPQYQTAKDLDVMVAFVKQYSKVASALRSIDLRDYTVYFGTDCKAEFGRKKIEHPPGWVGPAEPLVFLRSSCSLE